jgi:glycosyltransferase involved in cell wall biosynthesis
VGGGGDGRCEVGSESDWQTGVTVMKVLQLLGSGGLGGTERHAMTLVRGLIERGHESLLVNTWTDSPVNDFARADGVPFEALPGGGRRIGLGWFRAVYPFLRRHRFDLIHTYGLRVSLAVRLMQGRLGLRHHMTGVRGLDQQRTGWQARMDRLTERRLDMIVCNAWAVARERQAMVGTPDARIRVIPNGLDLSRFHDGVSPVSRAEVGFPNGFLFVHVGSFRVEKDHETLLRAFQRVSRSHDDVRLLLIGEGRLGDDVRRLVAELGVGDRVVMAGSFEDVRPVIKACDAFVLSSFSEGMPRALMEAMCLGMPCVSTRAGGVDEIADDGVEALLAAVRSPDALADAMERVVTDGELRSSLGRAAAVRAKTHFGRDLMIDRHVELYEDAMGGGLVCGERG